MTKEAKEGAVHMIIMITVHDGTFQDAIHLNQTEPNISCGVVCLAVIKLKKHP